MHTNIHACDIHQHIHTHTDIFVDEFDRICACAPIVDPCAVLLLQCTICLLFIITDQIRKIKEM